MDIKPQFLTEAEAAKYLGFAPITLRKSRLEGQRDGHFPFIPYCKVGRSVRYRLSDLDKYMDSLRVER